MKAFQSLLSDESFQRWLSATASDEEAQGWQKWLQSSDRNQQAYRKARAVWQSAQFRGRNDADIDAEWLALRNRAFGENDHQEARPYRDTLYRDRKTSGAWHGFARVGIALAVLAAISMGYLGIFDKSTDAESEPTQIVSTGFGQRATISLPEGTQIILNANSELTYPVSWSAETARRFSLRGEAFFDVSSLRDTPGSIFVVHTSDGTIRVTGTQFAIYERGRGTQVVVQEGGVEILADDVRAASEDSIPKALLQPGQLLNFVRGSRDLVPVKTDIAPYVTWWHKKMVLARTPLKEIVQRLEETYGVEVRVKKKELLEKTISGSIENHNLVTVTDALAGALQISVRREGTVVIFED